MLAALAAWDFSHADDSTQVAASQSVLDVAAPRITEIQRPHGRYVGWVVHGQEHLFADALLTRDGNIRIHIGGSYSVGTTAIADRWDQAAQFVGRVFVRDGVIGASGRLLGENCAVASPIRFCKVPARAKLKFAFDEDTSSDRLIASMTVTTGSHLETWRVVLDSWPVYYRVPVSLRWLRGLYSESTAEFSHYGETILDIDAAGRMYFQSPETRCVGNGSMAPRVKSGIVDVNLRIENCEGRFAYLNGRYDGFSTFSQSDYWAYDAILRTWLAKPAGSTRPAAITMWSIPR
jgi:hypothetical protein